MVVIEKVNTKIARKLRNLREKSGKTQKELADIMNLSTSAISMYEMGERVPSDKVKKQYALLFDVSIEDIFF
nr:MAG TPA_asm: helix-turn-helix domain protein [Caudoviricetes sp.]